MSSEVVNQLKIVMIGNGEIAGFHVYALKALGAEVTLVYRENSKTAKQFCRDYSIRSTYTDKEFLEDRTLIQSFDGMVIACDTEKHIKFLEPAIELRIPTLVEKPVSYDINSLSQMSQCPWIIVGFNRRYYASVLSLKREIERNTNVFMDCTLPQQSTPGSKKFGGSLNGVFSNLVHGFDLVRFLMGEPSLESRVASDSTGSVIAQYNSPKGAVIVKVLIDYPEALGIKIYMGRAVFNLQPIEALRVCRELAVVEPTSDFPLRRYQPLTQCIINSVESSEFKPGFYEQAEAFIHYVRDFQGGLGHSSAAMPGVTDALAAQVLLQQLYKEYL